MTLQQPKTPSLKPLRFARTPLGIWTIRKLTPLRVLLCLCSFINDQDECWPGMQIIADWTELPRSRIPAAITWLENNGWITVTRNCPAHGGRNRYRVIFPPKARKPPRKQKASGYKKSNTEGATNLVHASGTDFDNTGGTDFDNTGGTDFDNTQLHHTTTPYNNSTPSPVVHSPEAEAPSALPAVMSDDEGDVVENDTRQKAPKKHQHGQRKSYEAQGAKIYGALCGRNSKLNTDKRLKLPTTWSTYWKGLVQDYGFENVLGACRCIPENKIPNWQVAMVNLPPFIESYMLSNGEGTIQ